MARWAKRLSWTEVAAIFQTNWGVVHRAVKWVVDYGLTNRTLEGIESIGVDEIAVWKGHKYLPVVYQIDNGTRRLLWVARERTEESLRGFFDRLGTSRTGAVRFVASDMWKPYLKVIAERAGQALNVLDRFHLAKKLGEAVDKVRATEAKAMAAKGFDPVLKHSRWCFLKREENLTKSQTLKLADVLEYDLRTVRAYLLGSPTESMGAIGSTKVSSLCWREGTCVAFELSRRPSVALSVWHDEATALHQGRSRQAEVHGQIYDAVLVRR